MKELIKVSRASINEKLFDVTEEEIRQKFTGQELETALSLLPSEDEKEWMRIWRSTAPELERLRRKLSVCLDAEIDEMTEDKIALTYDEKKVVIDSPKNSFNISEAREKSAHAAFAVLCDQGCVTVDGKKLNARKDNIGVDLLSLLVRVSDKFFFQTYIT